MWRPLLLCCCLALAAGDEITLASGEVIDGEVIKDGDDGVTVRIAQGGMSAERTWPRSAVARIVRGESPRQRERAALRNEAATLPADAPAAAWTALAVRAKAGGDAMQARTWAERACARDRNQAEAQRLLGRELVNGVWMRPFEAAACRGEVWEDGQWISWPERERRRTEARARAERLRSDLAAAAERRRAAAAAAAAANDYSWPVRVTVPDTRVIWWGNGWQPQPPMYCPTPYPILQIGGNGRWGGVDWNFRLNW